MDAQQVGDGANREVLQDEGQVALGLVVRGQHRGGLGRLVKDRRGEVGHGLELRELQGVGRGGALREQVADVRLGGRDVRGQPLGADQVAHAGNVAGQRLELHADLLVTAAAQAVLELGGVHERSAGGAVGGGLAVPEALGLGLKGGDLALHFLAQGVQLAFQRADLLAGVGARAAEGLDLLILLVQLADQVLLNALQFENNGVVAHGVAPR